MHPNPRVTKPIPLNDYGLVVSETTYIFLMLAWWWKQDDPFECVCVFLSSCWPHGSRM